VQDLRHVLTAFQDAARVYDEVGSQAGPARRMHSCSSASTRFLHVFSDRDTAPLGGLKMC